MRLRPVVNSILKLGFKNKADDLTHLKVQKLLYFLNGWYLAIQGKRLIDEPFEAWPYGPVVPSLYEDLKRYGSSPIDEYILEWDDESQRERARVISSENKAFWDILEKVWDKYSRYTAKQLSTLSHERGSPWHVTPHMQQIDDEIIRRHFLQEAKKTTIEY